MYKVEHRLAPEIMNIFGQRDMSFETCNKPSSSSRTIKTTCYGWETVSLRKKCLNTELLLVRIFLYSDWFFFYNINHKQILTKYYNHQEHTYCYLGGYKNTMVEQKLLKQITKIKLLKEKRKVQKIYIYIIIIK